MMKRIIFGLLATFFYACSGNSTSNSNQSQQAGDSSQVVLDQEPQETGKPVVVHSFRVNVDSNKIEYKRIVDNGSYVEESKIIDGPYYCPVYYETEFEAENEQDTVKEIIKANFVLAYLDYKKLPESEFDDRFDCPVSDNGFIKEFTEKLSETEIDFNQYKVTKSVKNYSVSENYNFDGKTNILKYTCNIGDSTVRKSFTNQEATYLEYNYYSSDYREFWSFSSNYCDCDGCSDRDKYAKLCQFVWARGGSASEESFSVSKVVHKAFYTIVDHRYEYSFGGVHGFSSDNSTNIWNNGDTIKVYDVINQDKESDLMARLYEEYSEDYGLYESFPDAGVSSFYLSDTSVVVYWSEYEVAPYCSGNCEMDLPFDKYKEYLSKEFLGKMDCK